MLARRCWMCVSVHHNSWEGDIIGQRLASTMSALWEVQQDSGSWQPRRGETKMCCCLWRLEAYRGAKKNNAFLFLLHPSMMASPTATNPATLSSLGPKVTARGRSQPTRYQLHLTQNRMSGRTYTMSVTQESFHHFVSAAQQILEAVHRKKFCGLSYSCFYLLFDPD